MKLLFENSYGERRQIATVANDHEAFVEIAKFLEDHHFKSYYTRVWVNSEGETVFDVGSHTEFFYLIND